jgi:hypothetical protein
MLKLIALGLASIVAIGCILVSPNISLGVEGGPASILPARFVPPNIKPFDQKATDYSMPLDSIRRIYCGDFVGTGEVVNGNTFLTASHVVTDDNGINRTCFVNGSPAKIVYNNRALDYAIIVGDTEDLKRIPINCFGFNSNQPYLMIGYPKGDDFSVQAVIATDMFVNTYDKEDHKPLTHTRALVGKPAIPGMSGGPVFDLNGELVGTILAVRGDGVSLSRELKDTVLCSDQKQKTS